MPETREQFAQVGVRVKAVSTAFTSWAKKYRPWLLSGLTVFSILLIVWARFGFSLEIGQFFAAEPQASVQVLCDGNDRPCTIQAGDSAVISWKSENAVSCEGRGAFTDDPALPTQGERTVEPGGGTNNYVVSCQSASGAVATDSLLVSVEVPPGPSLDITCNDSDGPCTVREDETFSLAWTSSGADQCDVEPQESGVSIFIDGSVGTSGSSTIAEAPVGTYRFTLNCRGGSRTTSDTVTVVVLPEDASSTLSPSPSPSPSPTPTSAEMTLDAQVRNFTENGNYLSSAAGRPSQQFQVGVDLSADTIAPNVVVTAVLPETVSYVPGTTTIAGQPTAVDAIAQGGLSIGPLNGFERVTFVVAARGAGSLPSGTLTLLIVLRATGDGVAGVSDSVALIIENVSAVPVAAATKTGPGDVALLSFMSAALLTLLYVSYTHSRTFRAREVGDITRKREGMDFR